MFTQLLLMAAILFLGFQDPVRAPLMVAVAALLVATASATQDIVIDAFRVEYLPTDAQAAGMAYSVAAYRIGMLVSTAGSVAFVAYLEYIGVDRSLVWTYGYAAMAALVLVGMAAAFMAKEPREKEREAEAEALGERTGNPLQRFSAPATPPSPISSPRRRLADPAVRHFLQAHRYLRRRHDRAVRARYRLR